MTAPELTPPEPVTPPAVADVEQQLADLAAAVRRIRTRQDDALRAAAYRAAADELRKDHPDMAAGDGMFRAGILRAATRLAARADQMGQQ